MSSSWSFSSLSSPINDLFLKQQPFVSITFGDSFSKSSPLKEDYAYGDWKGLRSINEKLLVLHPQFWGVGNYAEVVEVAGTSHIRVIADALVPYFKSKAALINVRLISFVLKLCQFRIDLTTQEDNKK